MSNIAEKAIRMKYVFIWIEIKYEINSKLFVYNKFVPLKKRWKKKNFIKKWIKNTNNKQQI